MTKQNPFSVYDFLGYLIPGSLLIYSIQIINHLENPEKVIFKEMVTVIDDFGAEHLFIFIICSYILGHFISFVSSITVERYANWKYSFPSKYLLKIKHKGYWKSAKNWTDCVWRIVLIFLLAPCVIMDYILGTLLAFNKFYQQPIEHYLLDLTKNKIKRLLEHVGADSSFELSDKKLAEFDFHRIVTHFSYETSKNHQSRMSNYVALYGFLRNICLIFNVLAIYTLVSILTKDSEYLNFFLFFAAATYLSFMAFMKFYRRYSLEGFMVLLVTDIEKTVPNNARKAMAVSKSS